MSKQAVKLLAQQHVLQVGESTDFIECPFCHAKHEQKFSITRTEQGLLYNCFRASCPEGGGFVPTGYWDGEPIEQESGVTSPKRKPYRGSLFPLIPTDVEFFRKHWKIWPEEFRVTEHGEYAIPLLAPWNLRGGLQPTKGWIIRQPRWKWVDCPRKSERPPDYPKALTYKDEVTHSKLSWAPLTREATGRVRKHVVLVEDILSAWKVTQVSDDAQGVAINGTSIGYHEVKEICETRPYIVSIWLDPDATPAAHKLQNKWGLSFNHCPILVAQKDPKDLKAEQILEVLSNAGW
jgi:hypothetical protein